MHTQTDQTKAFLYKIIGDYNRFGAEFAKDDMLETFKDGALENYQFALCACESLNPCNQIRLGLALNLTVFHNRVMKNPKQANDIA